MGRGEFQEQPSFFCWESAPREFAALRPRAQPAVSGRAIRFMRPARCRFRRRRSTRSRTATTSRPSTRAWRSSSRKWRRSPTTRRRRPSKTRSWRWRDRASCSTARRPAFNCVTRANTDPELQKVQEYEAPRLAAHQDAIYLNPKLFARVKAIYDKRASLHLDPESLRLVEYDYQQFVNAGANFPTPTKTKLKKLNEEESTLENAFMTKLLAATKAGAYSTTDPQALAGLSEAQMAAAAEAAKARKQQGWLSPLQNTTQQPDLTFLSDRATRKAIFENSWNRAERGDANDTRSTIARLAQLRAQKGALLGYPELCGVGLDRPDGQDAGGGHPISGCAGAGGDGQGGQRGQRHSGADRRAARRVQARAVGLGVLCRAGAQGEVRSGRGAGKALLRAEQRARERRVLRGARALRPHLQGAPRHSGLPAGRARVRGLRRRRQAAGAVVLRLLQARQQERRRVDGRAGGPVEAAGHAARGLTTWPTSTSPRRGSPRCSASTT